MKSISIVEDDLLVTNVYSQKLRRAGFLVDVAADGKAGLARVHNRRVDPVSLDLLLPEIDGVEVLKQIRPLTARAAIAGLEGIAQMSAALKALLKKLCDAPERLSPAVALTIAHATDTLTDPR